jgi:hypothetical protein
MPTAPDNHYAHDFAERLDGIMIFLKTKGSPPKLPGFIQSQVPL